MSHENFCTHKTCLPDSQKLQLSDWTYVLQNFCRCKTRLPYNQKLWLPDWMYILRTFYVTQNVTRLVAIEGPWPITYKIHTNVRKQIVDIKGVPNQIWVMHDVMTGKPRTRAFHWCMKQWCSTNGSQWNFQSKKMAWNSGAALARSRLGE